MDTVDLKLNKDELKLLIFWRNRCDKLSETAGCGIGVWTDKKICDGLLMKLIEKLGDVEPKLRDKLVESEKEESENVKKVIDMESIKKAIELKKKIEEKVKGKIERKYWVDVVGFPLVVVAFIISFVSIKFSIEPLILHHIMFSLSFFLMFMFWYRALRR
jgi:hypothetical protein